MSVTDFKPPQRDPYAFMVGPFESYAVVIEGRRIPGLTAFKDGADEIALVVDGRFSVSVPKERAYDIAWLIANAIAVANGYPCLSSESKERPFAPQCAEIKL